MAFKPNRLQAAAIALKINNITEASPEADIVAATLKMQQSVAGFTNVELNHFVEELANKVLFSRMFERQAFKNPIIGMFFSSGTQYHSSKEIIDSKLLDVEDYDNTKKIADEQKRGKLLNIIIHEEAQKQIMNTIQLAGVRAAFASAGAFSSWLTKQLAVIDETMQIYMFEQLTAGITGAVKNKIDLDAAKFDTLDKVFVALTGITENMALPTVRYNMGYADPTDAANSDKVRKQTTTRSDLVLIAAPDTVNSLQGMVSPSKFHNAYFDTTKFGGVLKLNMPSNEVILVDKKAFEGWFRVMETSSQYWAKNLTTEHFLTFWYIFGNIPWANGVHVSFKADATGLINTKDL